MIANEYSYTFGSDMLHKFPMISRDVQGVLIRKKVLELNHTFSLATLIHEVFDMGSCHLGTSLNQC